ncbi:flagellar hook capping FlgD N-terminal domain-containing protein [Phycisphaera mikurensis]|uniref:Basal-body rod modification protein FlgD n=1 Tax=Phycisphaera mikurensis (strain NBRC 102666 / KCTC 22515 / FYK2301M01) TaxID=1142394 RepID=I0IGD8_PHYMF|nr:flagellar hook capping FlgD N-terminal domain-containing protein [Phycisphaera mikurensis]MBB6440296.1 flagellar basal-body rod modification protein FlgD [Phycisphaera mikurensis]BAM04326.1 putative basal-body rod modification protein FlgD [Phycisphaera mikurensis NBRC 102666]
MSAIASGLDLNALRGGSAPATPAAADPGGLGSLDNEGFMKIILQELSQQDPFEPNDTQQLIEQVSSLRNIESQQSLQTTLESLTLQSSMNQASGMLGKRIEALGGDGTAVAGVVERVTIVEGEARLKLDAGPTVPLDRVTAVSENKAAV